MSDEIDLIVGTDGVIQAIYSDDLAELFAGDALTTRRASHVEPNGDGWTADMRPVGGPVLYASGPCDGDACEFCRPFTTRQAALDAEVAWIRAQMAVRHLETR